MRIFKIRVKALILFLAIGLMSSHFFYGQNKDVTKNPILTDNFLISAGIFNPIKKVNISADGSFNADEFIDDEIDFDEDFGLNDFETTFMFNFMWRFSKSNKWSLRAEYFKISNTEKAVLDEDIEWNDIIFKEGTGVKGGFGLALYKIFIGRVISTGDKHELGGGLGVHALDVSAFIEGEAFIDDEEIGFERSEVSVVAPLPNIGLWYFYAPTEKLSFTAKLDWFGITIGDYGGSLWNLSPGVNYQVYKNIGLGLSYKFFRVDVDVDKEDWKGNFNMSYSGPAFTINAYF
ncbi:MAG: hypothetical protein GQ552_09720 [Flavobacteriaceae bacterium]|nr:hypothetical protein [Flavobacteriaceae bacterium]